MTGCNNFCSYCAVPYTRGREISRPAKEILCEIKILIKKGYKEIWLLGQNVNSYQSIGKNSSAVASAKADKIIKFHDLLKMVNEITGNFWIRFTSSHPKPSTRAELGAGPVPHRNKVSGAGDFSWDELIGTMANCKKVTEYLNLPVQSGDDKILKKMNRPYTIKKYKEIVRKIRNKIPRISLSTDIIVGFPGETKKQFQNTIKLFRKIKYDMAYIAKYSPRAGTIASKLKDSVSAKEKERRYKVLTEILKKTALEKNKEYIGKEVKVLVERQETSDKRQVYFGKTRTYKTVKIHNSQFLIHNSDLVGQFVKVKIIDALPWGLKGKLV